MGSDQTQQVILFCHSHFNPRPPHGERQEKAKQILRGEKFQSTPPAWGATPFKFKGVRCGYISIHAPRMGSDEVKINTDSDDYISIHAPRMGSDLPFCSPLHVIFAISIHAPRMGSDSDIPDLIRFVCYFNPRPPHGERPRTLHFNITINNISIHAPRMGSDSKNMRFLLCFCNFH